MNEGLKIKEKSISNMLLLIAMHSLLSKMLSKQHSGIEISFRFLVLQRSILQERTCQLEYKVQVSRIMYTAQKALHLGFTLHVNGACSFWITA